MSNNVRIPVEVDTREAQAKLKQLSKDKGKSKKRITSAARRTSRMAMRAFAFTGAASVIGKFQTNEPGGNVDIYGEATASSMGSFQTNAPSGNVDLIGEALTPFMAALTQKADDELGYSATARKSAREQTKAAFAHYVGRTGDMAGATNFYNTVSKMQTDVESGRNILRQDPRFIGPDLATATKTVLNGNLERFGTTLGAIGGLGSSLLDGMQYLIDGVSAD